ncbi:hypothetical protein C8R44DRAFT_734243 [Mycena epipterygia]|nr:hypothetical protein C8R44DRAFT_734243 [Mycena epipterygia]
MPTKVMILTQFGHGYYIRGTLKRLMGVLAWLKAWWIRILYPWDFEVADRYYIRGSLKRPTGVSPWLQAWWICMLWLGSRLGRSAEEMPAKVVILAQFGHGYYIRGTLKRLMGVLAWLKAWWICRLTDVVAWLKAWWICVSAKQVTDQKSMPLLPRWGGKVVIWLSLATDIISVGL